MFSDTAKRSAFRDAAAFSDAQKRCAPRYSHSPDKTAFSDRAKKSAFSDAQKNCATQLATGMSTFRDVAVFSDAHKRDAPAGARSIDKAVRSDVAAFSDAQINHTSLRTQEKQAFRGVATFRGGHKRDAPSCAHSPGELNLSDVAACVDTQISRSPSHVIGYRAQKSAPSKYLDGPARSGSATETPPNAEIRYTKAIRRPNG